MAEGYLAMIDIRLDMDPEKEKSNFYKKVLVRPQNRD